MASMDIKIDTSGFTEWAKSLKKTVAVGGLGVEVGILEGSTNDEGELIAEYAAANEFGTSKIPCRSFLRSTVAEKSNEWIGSLAFYIGDKIGDRNAVKRALTLVGRTAQMDIKAKIMSNVPPPNDPVYAESKRKEGGGYSGTLFNTGAMYKSINFSITEGGRSK